MKNSFNKKLKDNYVTKISDVLYLFENGETKRLIERNDRYSDWDIYWTDDTGSNGYRSKEPNPDRYIYNEQTLRSAIMDCYRDSITSYE